MSDELQKDGTDESEVAAHKMAAVNEEAEGQDENEVEGHVRASSVRADNVRADVRAD